MREQLLRVGFAKDADGGDALGDAGRRLLAQKFASLPPQLAALPEVADLILNATVGEIHRTTRRQPTAPDREPVLTEASGGRNHSAYTASKLEQRVAQERGIPAKEWEKSASKFVPGQVMTFEE
jgi:hypothetical protein